LENLDVCGYCATVEPTLSLTKIPTETPTKIPPRHRRRSPPIRRRRFPPSRLRGFQLSPRLLGQPAIRLPRQLRYLLVNRLLPRLLDQLVLQQPWSLSSFSFLTLRETKICKSPVAQFFTNGAFLLNITPTSTATRRQTTLLWNYSLWMSTFG
jgi:hypothetical protein